MSPEAVGHVAVGRLGDVLDGIRRELLEHVAGDVREQAGQILLYQGRGKNNLKGLGRGGGEF